MARRKTGFSGFMTSTVSAVTRGYNRLNAEANGESKIHVAAVGLRDQINTIIQRTEDFSPEVINAARGLSKDLTLAIQSDEKLPFKTVNTEYQLANACTEALNRYRPTLENAPGFWNQIKASVNSLIEAITGCKNYFETERTEFSQSVSYSQKLNGLEDVIAVAKENNFNSN